MKPLILIVCAGLIQTCYLTGQDKKVIVPVRSQTKHVTFKPSMVQDIKSVKVFPNLVIKDFVFTDKNSNKIIDADETSEISFSLVNEGEGAAENVRIHLSTKEPVKGISYNTTSIIGNVVPGQIVNFKIPIITDLSLQSGTAEFKLEAIESKGFDAFPLEAKINTREFQKPLIKVVDNVFSTDEGGKIILNYPINLKILVQNIGKGIADDVNVEFQFLRDNCVMLDSINRFELGSINPGEAVELEFPFTATRRYADSEIPVKIELDEKYKQYARDTIVSVGLNQSLQAKREVVIEGTSYGNGMIEIASLLAEVDRNIPVDVIKYKNKYALVIGNEDYTSRQKGIQNETSVNYANRDAEIFKEYLINTLGFIKEQVFILQDATSAEMKQSIDVITKLAQRTENAELVFYYAGHGLPDENTEVPYLIPVDVTGTNLTEAIKLNDIYNRLEESNAEKITVFLDACFSGGGDSRGIRVKPKLEVPPANTIVFSASSDEQLALPYTSKQHGMFTYFLLKKLQDTKGDITYGELAEYLQKEVSLQSLLINQKLQDPQVIYGDNNRDNWVNRPIK